MDGCNDAEDSLLRANIRADTLEGAFERAFLLLRLFGREEGRVILVAQRGQHAADGAIGHQRIVDLVSIHKIIGNMVPHFPEDVEAFGRIGGAHGAHKTSGRHAYNKGGQHPCNDKQGQYAESARALPLWRALRFAFG